MRSRIPLVFAGLLIIALIATVGLAAFTPGETDSTADSATIETLDMDLPISGRIASAVLALAVAPVRGADLATSTTIAVAESTTQSESAPDTITATTATQPASQEEPATTEAPETSTTAAATTSTEQVTTTKAASADTTPPALQVLSPKNGATVTSRVVEFTGVTERGAEVSSGSYAAETDDSGDWSINLVVAPGDNGAAFTARDAAGNETTVRIVVTYDPPTTTTTTKAPTVTTTTKAPTVTTTTRAPSSGYSSLWPADSAGRRDIEAWRSDVAAHWPSDRVDCVLGIIKLESGGDPTASNRGRYLGLMQHSATYWASRARGAGFVDSSGLVASPFNGEANIAAGAYLADYYDRIGKDWRSPWTVWSSVSACQS